MRFGRYQGLLWAMPLAAPPAQKKAFGGKVEERRILPQQRTSTAARSVTQNDIRSIN
jgi:hypothetical protein